MRKIKRLIFTILSLSIMMSIGVSSFAMAETWIKAESENFIVYSDVKKEDTVKYLRKLETFRTLMVGLRPRFSEGRPKGEKFRVYFVRRHTDMQKVWPEVDSEVAGFVSTCSEGVQAVSYFSGAGMTEATNLENAVENWDLNVLFHEYSHLFMANGIGLSYPKWFIEGFAEYYGPTRLNSKQALVGMLLDARYLGLNRARFYKWEEIISENPLTFEKSRLPTFYAQSALLTHYILSNSERTAKAEEFFATRGKEDKLEAFRRIFGISAKDLGDILDDYVRQAEATYYDLPDQAKIEIEISNLPDSHGELLLYEASLYRCLTSKDQAKQFKMISEIASKYPNDEYANNVLAEGQVLAGEETLALPFYEARIKKDANDSEAWFRLGQAKFLSVKNKRVVNEAEKSEVLMAARQDMFRSYDLNPLNSANLYYLSQTGINGEINQDLVDAAFQAFYLQPSVAEYAINALPMLVDAGQYEDAKKVVTALLGNPHSNVESQKLLAILSGLDNATDKSKLKLQIEEVAKSFN